MVVGLELGCLAWEEKAGRALGWEGGLDPRCQVCLGFSLEFCDFHYSLLRCSVFSPLI